MELADWVYIDQTEFLTIGFLAKDKLQKIMQLFVL
jgi:hypothetical protein